MREIDRYDRNLAYTWYKEEEEGGVRPLMNLATHLSLSDSRGRLTVLFINCMGEKKNVSCIQRLLRLIWEMSPKPENVKCLYKYDNVYDVAMRVDKLQVYQGIAPSN